MTQLQDDMSDFLNDFYKGARAPERSISVGCSSSPESMFLGAVTSGADWKCAEEDEKIA